MEKSLILKIFFAAFILISIPGCQEDIVTRDEIPLIKDSITAIENVIKARDPIYLDSLLCSEAPSAGTSTETILDFIYDDDLSEFIGFTGRQIFYRNDAARIDCSVSGPAGTVKEITITLKKENEVWLLKKIEPRIDNPAPPIRDTINADSV
ncbi:MAG: hypothetical protein V3V99_13310 [candidate division Zixibacteria bacterium]